MCGCQVSLTIYGVPVLDTADVTTLSRNSLSILVLILTTIVVPFMVASSSGPRAMNANSWVALPCWICSRSRNTKNPTWRLFLQGRMFLVNRFRTFPALAAYWGATAQGEWRKRAEYHCWLQSSAKKERKGNKGERMKKSHERVRRSRIADKALQKHRSVVEARTTWKSADLLRIADGGMRERREIWESVSNGTRTRA